MATSLTNAAASIEIADFIHDDIYGGETFRAEIVVVLEADGAASIDMRSVPANSWVESKAAESGREIHWTARIPKDTYVRPNEEEIRALIAEITPLLDLVHAGHSLEEENYWSVVGRLTAEAQEAAAHIQQILDFAEWWTEEGVADALEWLEYIEWEGVPVTATSTNAELKAMVERIARRAHEEDEIMVHSIDYALHYRRGELQEAEDA